MDKKDEAIIKVLERKAGLWGRSLLKLMGLPISTVHRRAKKSERERVIKGYRAIVDYEKTTRPIGASLVVNLRGTEGIEEIAEAITTEEIVLPPTVFIGKSLLESCPDPTL